MKNIEEPRLVRREHGFTMLEILTVLIIVGVLASVAVPAFSAQRSRAVDAQVVAASRSAAVALNSWALSNPPSWEMANLDTATREGYQFQSGTYTTVVGGQSDWCVAVYSPKAQRYNTPAKALVRTADGSGNCTSGNTAAVTPYADGFYNRVGTGTPQDAAVAAAVGTSDEAAFRAATAYQTAFWLTQGNAADAAAAAVDYANRAKESGKTGTLVLYNITDRDICGKYSSGGSPNYASYTSWVSTVTTALADSGAAGSIAVIVEPDALSETCSAANSLMSQRTTVIADVVSKLNTAGVRAIYLDAGNSKWTPPAVMAQRLRDAGVVNTRGISVNVSNFRPTSESAQYGHDVIGNLGAAGRDLRFIIDTSRNGRATNSANWCNPAAAGLGRTPSVGTATRVDAYLWVKTASASDGNSDAYDPTVCGAGSPAAGQTHIGMVRSLYANRNQ